MDNYQYERELINQGYHLIAGIDEVGRGPLIGPVLSACVVLPENFICEGLTDSKKLSKKKREYYYDIIKENAIAIGIGVIDEKIIDEVNIYQATKKAMTIAYNEARKASKIDYVLIDAMPLELDSPTLSIIKGDFKSLTIAAASVIAKVTRDRMMEELDIIYPMYDLKHNMGYPTKKHITAIKEYGITKYHRLTYYPVSEYKNNLIDKTIKS